MCFHVVGKQAGRYIGGVISSRTEGVDTDEHRVAGLKTSC
jgi:hypothetical protein